MEHETTLTCRHCDLEIKSSADGVVEITRTEFEWVCPNSDCDENNYYNMRG